MGTLELSFLDVFKNITIGIEMDATKAEELTRPSLGVSSNLIFFYDFSKCIQLLS